MMDWATWNHRPVAKDRPQDPAPMLVFWRVKGPSGRVVTCGAYPTGGAGVELRAGYSYDEMFRTQLVADIDVAERIAGAWRAAIMEKGSFEELPA